MEGRPHRDRLLNDLAAIEQQLSKLFEGSLQINAGEQLSGTWSPPVDIYETPSSFVLTAEVPGVNVPNAAVATNVASPVLVKRLFCADADSASDSTTDTQAAHLHNRSSNRRSGSCPSIPHPQARLA